MLIGIDASRANKRRKTGTEWYSYHVIKEIAQLDKKNKYILYTNKPLVREMVDLECNYFVDTNKNHEKPKFDKQGYQIIKSPHGNFRAKILKWPFYFFWTLGRLSLEMLLSKPDVLFIPAHTIPLFSPKKTITTIHDVAFISDQFLYRQQDMGSSHKSWRNIINFFIRILTLGTYGANSYDYLKWSTAFSLKNAKKIITVSQTTKKEIIEFYHTEKSKLVTVYNGYNNNLYQKINNQEKINPVLKKYGINSSYFLYIGRLEKKKNTPALIEAFAIFRENHKDIKHKLVLIGDASFGYDEVKYIMQEYNIDSEIIMPGWVEEADMPFLYNGAIAFVFPSKYEGFGIPILQAMGCGVPVLASDIPSLREVAGNAAFFFNIDDSSSLISAMENITLNDNLRKSLIQKGNERVKNFSWHKCAKETLAVIQDM